MIAMRWSRAQDSRRLSRIHRDAWRFAYAGVVPGLALERMIASRGEAAWQRLHRRGGKVLAVELESAVAGYAMIGPSRNRRFRAEGEIYELYLDPIYHGAGLGGRLFAEARRRLCAVVNTDPDVCAAKAHPRPKCALAPFFFRVLGLHFGAVNRPGSRCVCTFCKIC